MGFAPRCGLPGAWRLRPTASASPAFASGTSRWKLALPWRCEACAVCLFGRGMFAGFHCLMGGISSVEICGLHVVFQASVDELGWTTGLWFRWALLKRRLSCATHQTARGSVQRCDSRKDVTLARSSSRGPLRSTRISPQNLGQRLATQYMFVLSVKKWCS